MKCRRQWWLRVINAVLLLVLGMHFLQLPDQQRAWGKQQKNAEAKQKTDQYHHPLGLWFGIRCNCNFEHDTAEWHSAFRGCGTSSKKKTQKTNNIYLVQIIVKWIESSLMLHRVRRANAAAFAELKCWSEKETNNARKQFLFQFRIKAFDCDMILHCLIKCN